VNKELERILKESHVIWLKIVD